ncbi:MAG: hypothetical protein V2B18_15660, partial [Pseudomonadota bacterium]
VHGRKKDMKIIYHDVYLTDYPTASCETPDRVSSIMATIRDHYEIVTPSPAADSDILTVHTNSILNSVKMDEGLFEAAAMAAGGAVLAAELAMEGLPSFACVRPPGHHASPNAHWGFCFFNNVAISLERLLRSRRISTALVLDIDLHFGDGTHNFFSRRGNVMVENIQESARERFLAEVDRALASNEYDIVAISAGFDRHELDWGRTLTTEDYFRIGKSVREYAESKCQGRYYAVLEGGYNTDVMPANALALCRGMNGEESP